MYFFTTHTDVDYPYFHYIITITSIEMGILRGTIVGQFFGRNALGYQQYKRCNPEEIIVSGPFLLKEFSGELSE